MTFLTLSARLLAPVAAVAALGGTAAVAQTTSLGQVQRALSSAQSMTAMELAWQPARGWRGGMELRRSSRVYVNDANSDSAPSFTTLALHAGYVFDVRRWNLSITGRVDNVLDRRYAGSVIVNEGNGRFFEPAPDRSYVIKLVGSYAF